jgi:hypothetical protein
VPYTKRIVCLANSRKTTGRCIAGREFDEHAWGSWVRPISGRLGHEISEDDRRYSDGSMPALLDVIDIPMQAAQPHQFQRENHLIDDTKYWVRRGVAIWASLEGAVEDPCGPLWLNDSESSYGENDRVADADALVLTRSLYLVRPEDLVIVVAVEGGGMFPSKRRVRARFRLCGHAYCLSVTDPKVEAESLSGEDGETAIDDALLCVSLGESFHGHAYKLVAAVITP